jgi:hypothetical protein
LVPVNDGTFWGYGINWQSSVESVIFGTLYNSSLLLDEERSNLNAWTMEALSNGTLKYFNMLGIDNICHNGLEIFKSFTRIKFQKLAAKEERKASLKDGKKKQ